MDRPMPTRRHARNLVLVLGDQLSPGLSSLAAADRTKDVVLMAEVHDETTYVRHHKKKIAFVLSAMRHFAAELKAAGWRVDYVELDDPANGGSFTSEVARAVKRWSPERVIVTEPGEWRVLAMMREWEAALGIPVDILPDTRFIADHETFRAWAGEKRQLRMEFFYREIRRRTGLLMQGDEPEGGQWNFDKENRKPAPSDRLLMPRLPRFEPDKITRNVLALVAARFGNHFGHLEPFWFATTRADAEAAFDHFVREALPLFGDYQDAMLADERFLYHSVVSIYLNAGLLDPLAMCRKVEAAYGAGRVPLNAAEGYIRQVIGWREYVRGIYWLTMPGYDDRNFFGHDRPVPDFYWTGETDMACVKAAVVQTSEEAYAHHIQRLMVTGTFALLAGIDPKKLHEWYLVVYADAYEWVELPNTLGMSQFADGGLLASKPYAASGAYINRMSDYCGRCRYDVKARTGKDACPFNPLYWDFLARNREKLVANPRMRQMYATYDRFPETERRAIAASADMVKKGLTSSGDWP
jgi:deoxyribodipyrimidine photolyase-related protein